MASTRVLELIKRLATDSEFRRRLNSEDVTGKRALLVRHGFDDLPAAEMQSAISNIVGVRFPGVSVGMPTAATTPAATTPASAMPASAMPASAMPASAMPASAMPASAMPAAAAPAAAMRSAA